MHAPAPPMRSDDTGTSSPCTAWGRARAYSAPCRRGSAAGRAGGTAHDVGVELAVNLAGRKPWRARVLSIEGARIVVEAGGQRGPIVQTGIPADMLAAALKPGDPLEVYVHRSTKPGEAEFTTRHLDERYRAPAPPTVPAATPAGHEPALTASMCPPDGAGLPPPAATAESVPGTEAPPPPTTTPPSTPRPPAPPRTLREPSRHATLLRIEENNDIVVSSAGVVGWLVGPALVLARHARDTKPGQQLPGRVRRGPARGDGRPTFELVPEPEAGTVAAQLQVTQAWRKLVGTWGCRPGHIVRARIVAHHGIQGIDVRIHTHVTLRIPLEELDWVPVLPRQLSSDVWLGRVLRAKVTWLDPDHCRGEATLRFVDGVEHPGFTDVGSTTPFLHDAESTRSMRDAYERAQRLERESLAREREAVLKQDRIKPHAAHGGEYEAMRRERRRREQAHREELARLIVGLPRIRWMGDSLDVLDQLRTLDRVAHVLQQLSRNPGDVKGTRIERARGWRERHYNTGDSDDGRLYYRVEHDIVEVLVSLKHDQQRDLTRLRDW